MNKMINDKKGFAIIPAILILVGILSVGGGITYFVNKEKKFQQPVVVDETANWQIYKNEEYGFEFSYPNDFVIKEYPSSTALFIYLNSPEIIECQKNAIPHADNPCVTDLTFYIGNSSFSLDEIIKNKDEFKESSNINDLYKTIDLHKTTLSGESAYEYVQNDMFSSYHIIGKKGDKLYELIFGDSESTVDASKLSLNSELKQILLTFKLIK